jgi:hypothetical protein
MDDYKKINKQIQKDWFNKYNWKGRNGCYCSKCWEWCKMGDYDEWLKIHIEIMKEWSNRK